MCTVWIVSDRGVIKANPADLTAKARFAPVPRYEPAPKVQKQTKPVVKVRTTYTPAPLQRGGDLFKHLPDECWSKKDSVSHYSQRCGEHNHREQVFHKTERRRQVVRY